MNHAASPDPPAEPAVPKMDPARVDPVPVQLQLGRLTSSADLRGGEAEGETMLRKTGQLSRVRKRI